ncbi:Ribonuclease HII [Alistipes sp. cv1]|jgi:ribonuclease HII|nr:ribonuclease HII [uncultured Alistipes sp.]MDO5384374.1 ribonuclease HII [Rikenellaceae bacterium]VDR35655.1 Ribonuclease HII [Faecalibacterium prausnitzii]
MLKTCSQHELVEAGCDEAGRGPLAGPVAAAAVILPPEWNHPLLNDSKQMSEKNRYLLRDVIEREAVAWAVEMVFPEEIDRINILNASFAAMSRAVERLSVKPQLLLIDGNRFRTTLDIPYRCIVKGDATYASIAAASVLAKTYRDDYMMRIAEEYPVYNWQKNKGYPTREHREAVMRYGLSPYHRMSFNHEFEQLRLFERPAENQKRTTIKCETTIEKFKN